MLKTESIIATAMKNELSARCCPGHTLRCASDFNMQIRGMKPNTVVRSQRRICEDLGLGLSPWLPCRNTARVKIRTARDRRRGRAEQP